MAGMSGGGGGRGGNARLRVQSRVHGMVFILRTLVAAGIHRSLLFQPRALACHCTEHATCTRCGVAGFGFAGAEMTTSTYEPVDALSAGHGCRVSIEESRVPGVYRSQYGVE